MRTNPELLNHLFPAPVAQEHTFEDLLQNNPLPPELKAAVLQELMGRDPQTDALIAQLGLQTGHYRELSVHEKVTLAAVLGRGGDVGSRELMHAIKQTRGADLMAWADLAAVATHMRAVSFQ